LNFSFRQNNTMKVGDRAPINLFVVPRNLWKEDMSEVDINIGPIGGGHVEMMESIW